MASVKPLTAKQREGENILARKCSNTSTTTSTASVGTVRNSKTRLLANNKSLALLLNKKKLEVRYLREKNRQQGICIGRYKIAHRVLLQKLHTTNSTIRNLQNAAPIIQRDISSLLNRFDKMSSVLSSVDTDDIENQSLLTNLDMTEQNLSNKLKTARKRNRVINKVRPMKYGLVLGNPVVSLHRLRPPSAAVLSTIPQVDTEEYTTDTEMDIDDPDAIDTAGTASGQASPNSPISTLTSVSLTSQIQSCHTVGELSFSVPLLEALERTASVSPTKRPRLTDKTPPTDLKLLKKQKIQLATPCRVLIENLRPGQSSSSKTNTDTLLTTSLARLPSFQTPERPSTVIITSAGGSEKKKKLGRPAKVRQAFSDGETEPTKKQTAEELMRSLTPLKVEVKLNKIAFDSFTKQGEENTEVLKPHKRRPRKSLPPPQPCFSSDSDDSEEDWRNSNLDKGIKTPNVKSIKLDSSKITKRSKITSDIKKKPASKVKQSPVLKVKFWGNKNLQSKKSRVSTDDEADNEEESFLESPSNARSKVARRLKKSDDSQEVAKPKKKSKIGEEETSSRKTEKQESSSKSTKKKTDDKENEKSKEAEVDDSQKAPAKRIRGKLALNYKSKQNKSAAETESSQSNKTDKSKNRDSEDHDNVEDMVLDSGNLNSTYIIEVKSKPNIEEKAPPTAKKVALNKPCPKSKKNPAHPKAKEVAKPAPPPEEELSKSEADSGSLFVEESAQNLPEEDIKIEVPKAKKAKPMPLSKKRELGLLNSEELQILEERIVAPGNRVIKQEELSASGSEENNSHDYMRSFLKRISLEDPLEGTSRQHVYKKPNPPSQKEIIKKKSLRLLDKKTYEESPLSDCPPQTDDETWYPKGTYSAKKK